jgi:hypothetical protein
MIAASHGEATKEAVRDAFLITHMENGNYLEGSVEEHS